MAQHQVEEQLEHNMVVHAAVGHRRPGIIVTERGSSKVRFIIEVETGNRTEASEVSHWRTPAGLGPAHVLRTPQQPAWREHGTRNMKPCEIEGSTLSESEVTNETGE